jgi:hypothetical protein
MLTFLYAVQFRLSYFFGFHSRASCCISYACEGRKLEHDWHQTEGHHDAQHEEAQSNYADHHY